MQSEVDGMHLPSSLKVRSGNQIVSNFGTPSASRHITSPATPTSPRLLEALQARYGWNPTGSFWGTCCLWAENACFDKTPLGKCY